MSAMTQAEFARFCQVNRSTVTRWIQNGRIQPLPNGLIDAGAANRMREATESQLPHHQARKAGIELEKQALEAAQTGSGTQYPNPLQITAPSVAGVAANALDATGDDNTEEATTVNGRYKLAMAREREAKAELAAMEVDQLAGTLVERSEVEFVLADFGNTLRSTLESLPDRLAGQLAALRGDTNAMHKSLDDTLRDVLASLAEQMKRRMEDLGK